MTVKSTSLLIGQTSRGVRNPVPFDLHTPIRNNQPPGCVITGKPGSGKTYLLQLLTTMSALLGKTTIVIDLKGDFLNLKPIADEIGVDARFIDIAKKKGALDPFYIGENPGDKLSLILQVIDTLVGGITRDESTLLTPEIRDLIQASENKRNQISLTNVVSNLLRSTHKDLVNIGSELESISTLPYANLLFAPGGGAKSKINYYKGLTIFPLIGLKLPNEEDFDENNSRRSGASTNINENLSSAIMLMLTEVVSRLMMRETPEPKTLVIDEAWVLASNKSGQECIKKIALLGRSKNIALVMGSQKNSHYSNFDIDVTISTRFCFKTSIKEAEMLVKELQLPEGEGFENNLTELQSGECLMMDWIGNYSTVQIETIKSSWHYYFRSDPQKEAAIRRSKGK